MYLRFVCLFVVFLLFLRVLCIFTFITVLQHNLFQKNKKHKTQKTQKNKKKHKQNVFIKIFIYKIIMTSQLYFDGMKNIFKYFNSNHRKEKLDYVLEPLQAMVQLSLLSFCPVGTKLTIYDNLLYIQQPGLGQGIIRYLNDDTKDDLYFLLNVFRRFIIYYDFLKQNNPELYNLLINYSQKGLDKLIQTYSDANKVSLLHSLKMYKLILNNGVFFENLNNDYYDSTMNTTVKTENNDKTVFMNWFSQLEDNTETKNGNKANLDNVFKEITKIYDVEYINLYEDILKTLSLNKDNIQNTIDGVNMLLKPINEKIKKWINQHIAL